MSLHSDSGGIKKIAHDLRNIHTNITTSLDVLRQKLSDRQELLDLLAIIETNTARASEIIDSAVGADNGKSPVKRRISLSELIKEAVTSFKKSIGEDVEISVEYPKSDISVEGNFTNLFRVLLNLIVNAKESLSDHGIIQIKLQETKECEDHDLQNGETLWARISVKDNGCGIPEEDRLNIFDEGFSTKSKDRESGLGLSIVKEVIDDHDGQITVESKEGEGTLFAIYLPIKKPAADVNVDIPKTVLVADDEDVIRELLKDLFQTIKYKVLTASNGEEVIELIKGGILPDIMIIDKKMPGMNGIETIKKLRSEGSGIPIILATGSAPAEESDYYSDLNLTAVIQKPFNFEQLFEIVKKTH